jgi:hypothetical protein
VKQTPDSSAQYPTPDRSTALRIALVDTVNFASRRTQLRPRLIIVALAVFALAGAGTGAALSAAASSHDDEPTNVTIDATAMASQVVFGDTVLYGNPFIVASSGTTIVKVGERPDGATALLLAFRCESGPQHVDYTVDGRWDGSADCDQSGGGTGGQVRVDSDLAHHELRFVGTGRYLVWASWVSEPATPGPSAAEQAEIADGVATWEEYKEALVRYSACSAEAGYPFPYQILEKEQIIAYGPSIPGVESGMDRICYGAEFAAVDELWQALHPLQPQP